jgi:hypothetical protein
MTVTMIELLWYFTMVIQGYLSFGTAYRYTKIGGDNGVALFGWLFVFGLASVIPGLGFYLWHRSKKL